MVISDLVRFTPVWSDLSDLVIRVTTHVDVDVENFTGADCYLYAQIQITNYDNVIH